jgi:hypothetical protein
MGGRRMGGAGASSGNQFAAPALMLGLPTVPLFLLSME